MINRSNQNITIGGRTMPTNVLILKGYASVNRYTVMLDSEDNAYQVPVGKKLRIIAASAYNVSSAYAAIKISYGDTAPVNSSTAPTNYSSTDFYALVAKSGGSYAEIATDIVVPASKYPVSYHSEGSSVTIFCLLEDA